MILLLILVFNWLLLFWVLRIGVSFFNPVSEYQAFLLGCFSFVIICGLAFLFHSPLGQWVLRLISGARRPIAREADRLDPIIDHVQQAVETRLGLSKLTPIVMIVDDPLPNAFAIGRSTLVVSRALYEIATEEELAGVIAHEFGHLHSGDSHRLGIALGVSFVSLTVTWVIGLVAMILQGAGRALTAARGDEGLLLGALAMALGLLAGFFLLFVRVGDWLFRLAMLFVGRRQEYRADAFAIKMGFGEGLLSFLDMAKNFEFDSSKSLLGRLDATHPSIMLRIGEVEKLIHQPT